jgi:hypothetical protein
MTKNKSKTYGRWEQRDITPQYNSGEVITQPNQSMSIREILFRNTQGMTYDNYKTPYYEDQATFSSISLNKIQDMEETEKLQYLAEVKEQVTNLKTKIENHKTVIDQAAAEQAAPIIENEKSTED